MKRKAARNAARSDLKGRSWPLAGTRYGSSRTPSSDIEAIIAARQGRPCLRAWTSLLPNPVPGLAFEIHKRTG